jgi:hypothetical protein
VADESSLMKRQDRKQETADEQDASFSWREVPCTSEAAAKAEAEAEAENTLEEPEEAEWIYLRNTSKQWVARRAPRHLPGEPKSFKRMPWASSPATFISRTSS